MKCDAATVQPPAIIAAVPQPISFSSRKRPLNNNSNPNDKTASARRERCVRNPRHKLETPNAAEAASSAHSVFSCARKLKPINGKIVTTNGIAAQ